MVQVMGHEAVEGDMDQEAVEGAMDGASDGRSDRWYKRWITKPSKNQEAVEASIDVTGRKHMMNIG